MTVKFLIPDKNLKNIYMREAATSPLKFNFLLLPNVFPSYPHSCSFIKVNQSPFLKKITGVLQKMGKKLEPTI